MNTYDPASCKRCALCVPKQDVAEQDEFYFPGETECGAGYDEYPDLAYCCIAYAYNDNGYKEYMPVWRRTS